MATNSAARALDKEGFDMVNNLRGEGLLQCCCKKLDFMTKNRRGTKTGRI
jgi:hypothetical protein